MENNIFPIEKKNSLFDKSIELVYPIFEWTLFDSIGQPSQAVNVKKRRKAVRLRGRCTVS